MSMSMSAPAVDTLALIFSTLVDVHHGNKDSSRLQPPSPRMIQSILSHPTVLYQRNKGLPPVSISASGNVPVLYSTLPAGVMQLHCNSNDSMIVILNPISTEGCIAVTIEFGSQIQSLRPSTSESTVMSVPELGLGMAQ